MQKVIVQKNQALENFNRDIEKQKHKLEKSEFEVINLESKVGHLYTKKDTYICYK